MPPITNGDFDTGLILLYAADARNPKLTVLLAAAAALVLTSAIGVLAGSLVSRHVSARVLSWIAGAGFILIGIWTIARAQ